MSTKSLVPILISSTPPSKPSEGVKALPSRSYRCLNVSCEGVEGSKTCGDTNSFNPLVARSGEKAAFGAVSASELVVRQFGSPPDEVVVQLAGNAGTVTESKF